MGELALFQTCNQLLEVIVGKIAGKFFRDSLCGLGRWCVKQHDRCHILSERLCDAGKLLGQYPQADAGVAALKAELDRLPCTPDELLMSLRRTGEGCLSLTFFGP